MTIKQVWNEIEEAFGITDVHSPIDLEPYLNVSEAEKLSSKLLSLLEAAQEEFEEAQSEEDESDEEDEG